MRAASIAAGLLLAGCGSPALVVSMNAENNSGENGTATLTERGGALEVRISLAKANDPGPQVTHLHEGRCGEIGPPLGTHPKTAKAIALEPLREEPDGGLESTSKLPGVSLDELRGGGFAINVHYSRDPTLYVSCGNIP